MNGTKTAVLYTGLIVNSSHFLVFVLTLVWLLNDQTNLEKIKNFYDK